MVTDLGAQASARADALMQQLRASLEPDESVLWSGIPRQDIVFGAQDFFLVPFSLMWGGFAFFWEFSVIGSGAPLDFALFGLPFILAAIYIIAGRFVVDAMQRARTLYAVTERRIIILSGLTRKNLRSLMLRGLNEINTNERADGSGTITFGPSDFTAMLRSGWPWVMSRTAGNAAFEGIAGMREVLRIVREAQRKLAASGGF